ncbi:aminobenzoyl-glutamate transporter [Caldalkalibacillus thermarum]|uniref:AbgT family transporter n=1 Tax=Caldalkalibacillus thermarum TaxID=296745 RepID=UPI00166AE5E0|nr:AbgT family transporter [Caldalkalibacillus thermarum]GGK29943.1 aminobenzoyl-glutamate transporter [Caldalkalibacillus thermarum]
MSTPGMNRPTPETPPSVKQGFFNRFLNVIEIYGNKLPDPVTLFVIFALAILVASAFSAAAGVSAVNPSTEETIEAVNLLSGEGLIQILTGMVTNFAQFPPLGLVLVVMIGVGLAEATGLIQALMRRALSSTPPKYVIPAIIFIGMLGNMAGDAAFVVLPPIAALLLMGIGFNPLTGLILAYASIAGGFAANLIVNMLDVLVAGFTEVGAQIMDPEYTANPAMNWYFLAVSFVVLVIVATIVTNKITIPRLGKYEGEVQEIEELTEDEKRGLRWAGWAALIYVAVLLVLTLPSNAILRNPDTGSLVSESPLMSGLVPIIMFLFLIPALFYGLGAKTIKTDKDVAKMLGDAMATMGPYIVLAFVAAQMIAYFNWSNLGPIIAIKGAEFLQSIGLTGIGLVVGFVIISALINLLVASSSAKWAILAPVFVPMFMILGYDPAFTQMAYRIGDSITNPITPMLPYFAILLSFAKMYNPKVGIGTLMSALLPYTIFFSLSWIAILVIWFFTGLPLGPDGHIFLPS